MQHVYISYPADDYELAHRLAEDLQAAGYAVFIDAAAEVGTMAWAAETRRAIRTCGAMIIILPLADWRRIGIRHEGVLAKRRRKPVVVLARSAGDLPRYLYLADAAVIDCSDGAYDTALAQLLDSLPPASALLTAPAAAHPLHRTPPARRRRRLVVFGTAAVMVLCFVIGVASGVIPV